MKLEKREYINKGVKMRVAYILFKYPKESETFVRDEIKEIIKYVDVTVFSITKSSEKSSVDVKIVYPKRSYNLLKLIKWGLYLLFTSWRDIKYIPLALGFANCIKQGNFDHIHTWFSSSTATISYLISMETKIPYSFSAHSRDIFVKRESKKLMLDKIKHAKFILVPSEWHRKYMIKNYGFREKYYIIPNSIYPNKFKSKNLRKENKIIFIGRDVEKKGLKYLKRALELLGNKYKFVHIHGGVPEEELVKELNTSKVFVMPSVIASDNDSDGIPTVVLEAMASGIPVVSTNIRALPEAVEGCGILVEEKNPRQIAAAIEKIMKNKNLREKYGRNGLKRVKEKFDVVKNTKKLVEILRGETT